MVASQTVHDIIVEVPIHTAYNQWTQFEEFPSFMRAVESVVQLGDDRVHFRLRIAGHVVEYDAQILEQIPDRRIVWESVSGDETGGVVTFEEVASDRTRVSLSVRYAPNTALEKIADLLGLVSKQSQNDLANFKEFIESRGVESGAWRGGIGSRNP